MAEMDRTEHKGDGSELPKRRRRWALNERFLIGQPGNPMLQRWRLFSTPLFGLYLHFIYREDLDPIPHDHPWPFRSFVLRGGYSEVLWPDARVDEWRVAEHGRWSCHSFPLATAHRIAYVSPGTVTLVLVGRKVRTWGFWKHDRGRNGAFIDWRDALNLRPTEGEARKRPRTGAADDPPVLIDHAETAP